MSIQGACTLAATNIATGVADGMQGKILVTHDAAGATLAAGTGVIFPSGGLGLSAGLNDVDMLSFVVVDSTMYVWGSAADFV